MAEQDLGQTMALLARTPAVLDALLRGLPEGWTCHNEGADTWSAYAVLGHLIHGESTDWMPRVRMILAHGATQTFEPFDRRGFAREGPGKTMEQMLEQFAERRARNLQELRELKLTAADMERRGRHPALGEVTLGQLLGTWAAHDLTHLHQISRVMAHQYRDAVGPWSRFMGVLNCNGHSE
ncbi:MAG: DinB family protein [Terriglobales bacterium]